MAEGRSAYVTSIDALRELAAALRSFSEEGTSALWDLDVEVNRAVQWVQQDQKEYWRDRARRGWDEVAEARNDLERCLIIHAGEERPACHEERVALERAKRRLQVAQEKVEAVRHWSRVLDHELNELRGGIAPLSEWLEIDAARALALLDRMAGALELYVTPPPAAEPPAAALPPAAPVEDEGAAAREPLKEPLKELSEEPSKDGRLPQEDPHENLGLGHAGGQAGAGHGGAAQSRG